MIVSLFLIFFIQNSLRFYFSIKQFNHGTVKPRFTGVIRDRFTVRVASEVYQSAYLSFNFAIVSPSKKLG